MLVIPRATEKSYKHAYPGTTYRRDKKIAYVTLKEGDKIRVFEEETKTTEKENK